MNFQESIQTCFRKYAEFSGRASRPELWWFYLFLFVGGIVVMTVSTTLYYLFWLGTLLPAIAVTTRRLHDTNRSGWWQLLSLTFIGAIVVLVFLALPSEPGTSEVREAAT